MKKILLLLFFVISFQNVYSDPHEFWTVSSQDPGLFSGVDASHVDIHELGHSLHMTIDAYELSGQSGNQGFHCQHSMWSGANLAAQSIEMVGMVVLPNSAGDQGRTGSTSSGSRANIVIVDSNSTPTQVIISPYAGGITKLNVKTPETSTKTVIDETADNVYGFSFRIKTEPRTGGGHDIKIWINGKLEVDGGSSAYNFNYIKVENHVYAALLGGQRYKFSQSIKISKLVIDGVEKVADCQCEDCDTAFTKSKFNLKNNEIVGQVGTGSGKFTINTPYPFGNANITDASSVIYNSIDPNNDEVIQDSNGSFRQVKNNRGLSILNVISDDEFVISQYSDSKVGAKDANGEYTTTGDPDSEISFSKTTADPTTLKILETYGGVDVNFTTYSWNATAEAWVIGQDIDGDGTIDRKLYTQETYDVNNNLTKTHYVLDAQDNVFRKTTETFDSNKNLVSNVIDPDNLALTTSYQYNASNQLTRIDSYDGSWETYAYNANNLIELHQYSSGKFEEYEYDASNRVSKKIENFNNSTYSTTESEHKVTTYDYTPVVTGDDGSVSPDEPRTITVTALGQPVSKTFYGFLAGETHQIKAVTPTSGVSSSGNLTFSTYLLTSGDFAGQPSKTVEPGGKGSMITYNKTGNVITTTRDIGVFNGAGTAIIEGVQTVEIKDNGKLVSLHTFDIATSLLINSRIVTERDDFDREKRVDYHDGTYEMFYFGCCNLDSTQSRDGVSTYYTYDNLKQITSTTRNGVTEEVYYDLVGNILEKKEVGADSSVKTLSKMTYDSANRVTSVSNALDYTANLATTYNSGNTTSTETYPDGTTKITTVDEEGELVSLSGTGVFSRGADLDEERIELDNDLGYYVVVKKSGLTEDWIEVYQDALERNYKSVSKTGAVNKNFYDTDGNLIKSQDQTGAVTLYYEEKENGLSISALDVNQNGTIDYGTDTISRTDKYYVSENQITWLKTQYWDNPDSLATPGDPDEITKVSNDGLAREFISITTGIASTFDTRTIINQTGVLTTTSTSPDGSYTESKLVNGYQEYVKSFDVNDVLLQTRTFYLDTFNRLEKIVDSRNGTTQFSYSADDKVLTTVTTDPDDSGPESTQTYSNTYNSMGRRTKVVNPDNTEINFEYTNQGLLYKSYGDRVYPRQFAYDSKGQLQSIKTWKNYGAQTGDNQVTWGYNDQGQLTSETDKAGRQTTFTYYTNGLLKTKTNPRSIVKTFNYDSHGRISSVTYSDSTPSISFTYNELGEVDSITDEAGTRNLNYNALGQFTGTSWVAGVFSGIDLTYNYDSIGRQASYVRDIGVQQRTISYEYDDYGRLEKVIKGSHEFEYLYLNESPGTVERMNVYKSGSAQLHSLRQFDKLMRTKKLSWFSTGQ